MSAAPADGLEFRILGPLEVVRSTSTVELPAPRARRVLAALLLRPRELVTTDSLIENLWGDAPPQTAENTLQVYVSQLRKVLEPERGPRGEARVLEHRAGGYVLHVAPDQLDASRFERLAAEGRSALEGDEAERASEVLRSALSLWRGDALAEFAYDDFARDESSRLTELRLAALEDRVAADLALGRHRSLVPELDTLTSAHPERERLHELAMLALYRCGRQSEALDHFRRTRERLLDELGLEPGPALQELERAILRQDPSLAGTAARVDAPEEHERRRTVTALVLTVDVTAAELLDPETSAPLSDRALGVARAAAERQGAYVDEGAGKTIVALFGVPAVHEDDASRALRAALDARDAVAAIDAEVSAGRSIRIELRCGLATAPAVVGRVAGRLRVAGSAADEAARLRERAAPGEVLADRATLDAAGAGVASEPRSDDGGGCVLGLAAAQPRAERPLVGRRGELARLRHAFERSRDRAEPQLALVLGEPGIGKSRLARALAEDLAVDARVLTAACAPYGSAAERPLPQLLRAAVGDDVAAGVAAALAGTPDATRAAARLAAAADVTAALSGDVPWAFRLLLEALGRERPLVLVLDDLQWADPGFLDLVEHVVERSAAVPLLVLGLARPELLEERARWDGGLASSVVRLRRLSARDSEALLDSLGGATVSEDVRARIAGGAEGNPLFLEQLHAHAVEHGAEASLPPSMRALLAARLDTLSENDRRVLEAGAVVGSEVRADELHALAGVEDVAAALDRLVRKQLLGVSGDVYRFAHQLVRDAAYEAIPKRRRAELHEQVADRLRGTGELEGLHLEQASRYRLELDPNDPRAAEIAMRASKVLGAAGSAAAVRGEVRTAVGLLRRSLDLPFQDVRVRAERLADLGAVLREAGELTEADRTVHEALDLAGSLGDRATAARARLTILRLTMQTDPASDAELIGASAEQEVQELEQRGDDATLAEAWFIVAWTSFVNGKIARAEEALRRSILHAERAGARASLRRAVNLYLGTGVFGPTPAAEAVARCEATLAGEPERATEAAAYRALGALHMLQGDFAGAREFLRRDAELCDELGLRVAAAAASEHVATIELYQGDFAAAEETAREGYAVLDALGDTSAASTLVAILAEAVFRQGRLDEAISWTEVSESLAMAQDVLSQTKWRATRAQALAHSGDRGAEALAREAVAIARDTEMPVALVEALSGLAAVLQRTGGGAEARTLAQEAIEIANRKGDRVRAARAAELAGI